jgi:hypothetical protein
LARFFNSVRNRIRSDNFDDTTADNTSSCGEGACVADDKNDDIDDVCVRVLIIWLQCEKSLIPVVHVERADDMRQHRTVGTTLFRFLFCFLMPKDYDCVAAATTTISTPIIYPVVINSYNSIDDDHSNE